MLYKCFKKFVVKDINYRKEASEECLMEIQQQTERIFNDFDSLQQCTKILKALQ